MSKARVVALKNTPPTPLRGRGVGYHMLTKQMGSQHIEFRINLLPPDGPPGIYHYHETVENVYFILEGEAEVVLDGETHRLGPNHLVYIPPGVRHSITNVGEQGLKLIELYGPAEPDFIKVEEEDE